MKERLIQLLDLEQLSPSKFADLIGVQRSSISHVLSGRNKPSFDFLQKTLKAFPGLNASWLLLGEGTMYERMGRTVSGNLFDAQLDREVPAEASVSDSPAPSQEISRPEKAIIQDETGDEPPEEEASPEEGEKNRQLGKGADLEKISGSSKRIVQVMVLYEDDTFRSFRPGQ